MEVSSPCYLPGKFNGLTMHSALKRLTDHPIEPQGSQAKYEGCGAFCV